MILFSPLPISLSRFFFHSFIAATSNLSPGISFFPILQSAIASKTAYRSVPICSLGLL